MHVSMYVCSYVRSFVRSFVRIQFTPIRNPPFTLSIIFFSGFFFKKKTHTHTHTHTNTQSNAHGSSQRH